MAPFNTSGRSCPARTRLLRRLRRLAVALCVPPAVLSLQAWNILDPMGSLLEWMIDGAVNSWKWVAGYVLKKSDMEKYELFLRETRTWEIIDDVKNFRSEIGVLFLNGYNRDVLTKMFDDNRLTYTSLFKARPHIFVSKSNPLAKHKVVSLEDLEDFPYLSYDQGIHNSFYYSEEILSQIPHKKSIVVSDRATLFNLLIGLDGYTIATGILNSNLNGDNIVSIPLDVDDEIDIVYLKHQKATLSKMGEKFLDNLVKEVTFDN